MRGDLAPCLGAAGTQRLSRQMVPERQEVPEPDRHFEHARVSSRPGEEPLLNRRSSFAEGIRGPSQKVAVKRVC